MRLNPKVQEVVKDDIIKLLDTSLIYPISDSLWVSPIHVVPKKGGMTIIVNDDSELIPTRTIEGCHSDCNPPATFQRCVKAIFHDRVEEFMEDAKARLIQRVLFLQEFINRIKDKKGAQNLAAYHLYRLENPEMEVFVEEEIANSFVMNT
ncbi:hypothetical protein Tco_1433630 [Tanacetum coccineum]